MIGCGRKDTHVNQDNEIMWMCSQEKKQHYEILHFNADKGLVILAGQ